MSDFKVPVDLNPATSMTAPVDATVTAPATGATDKPAVTGGRILHSRRKFSA